METNFKLAASKAEVNYIISVCINNFLNHTIDDTGKLISKNVYDIPQLVLNAIQKDGFSINGIIK